MTFGFTPTRIMRIAACCTLACLGLVNLHAAEEAAVDSDGDGLPDAQDSLPALATVPLHWTVQALAMRWAGLATGQPGVTTAWDKTNALTLFSAQERDDVPGSRLGACATASPLDWLKGDRVQGNGLLPLGTFGSDEMHWQAQQRLRVQRFSRNLAGAGRGVELVFEVQFRNFSEDEWRIAGLRVPILAGGRRVALAQPADLSLLDRGIVLPGARPLQVTTVTFVADVPGKEVADLFQGLQTYPPRFVFEQAEGTIFAPSTPDGEAVTDRFKAIRKRTVAVKIRGGDGQVLVWRMAREVAGVPQTVGLWAEVVNGLSQQQYGRPVWLEEQGFLVSLSGWDTGAWDLWWHLSELDKSGADWSRTRLKGDVAFELREAPAVLSRSARDRLSASEDHPILLCLAGRHAWLAGDEAAAAEAYRRAAERNYASGLNWLGFCQAEGRGVAKDAALALGSYQAAAKQNYAPGEAWLGGCHLRGNGVAMDRAAAAKWLGKAAAQGHPEGSAIYALCLTRGLGVKADPVQGLQATRRAAWLDSPIAQFALGLQLLDVNDPEGVDWLHCAAQAGDARAQVRLARCLSEGVPVPKDPQAAMVWYAKAAEQGEVAAQLALGRALRSGYGVKRNLGKAAHWFGLAAEQGNLEAQTWRGMMLLDGQGVRRDAAAGLAMIRQAAENGFAQAQYLLGLCYYAGFGETATEPAEAVKWFKAAAAQQNPAARIFVGFCYYEGRGVAQDRTEAVRYFQEAADQESAVGQIWLAYCLAFGEGVAVDLDLAREWAQKAWRQGHPGGREMLRKIPRM
jgi:TPR repeat protein